MAPRTPQRITVLTGAFMSAPTQKFTTSPINTANREASSGNQWTVPLGGGVGKVVFAGDLPINLQLQAYYNVVTPDNGPDWSMRFQIQTVLPKSLFGMK